jgi:hypothetical protein
MFNIIHPARETSDVLQICRISSMRTSQSKATQTRQLPPSATPVFCQRSMSRDSEVAAKRKDTRHRGSGPVFLWSVKGRLETGTLLSSIDFEISVSCQFECSILNRPPPSIGADSAAMEVTTQGVSSSGGCQCQMLNSSGNMPRKRYFGLAKPKQKKRSKPMPTLRSHGRELRCRASTFLASTTVRQRPGLCKARLSWRSPQASGTLSFPKIYPHMAMVQSGKNLQE